MRRIMGTLIALSMLIAMSAPAFIVTGQNPNAGQQPDLANDPLQPGHTRHKMPPSARIGSTKERRDELNKLKPDERENARKTFKGFVAKAAQDQERKKHQDDDEPTSLTASFKDKDNNRHLHTGKKQKKGELTLTSSLKIRGTNRYITLANTAPPSDMTILKAVHAKTAPGDRRAHASRRRSRFMAAQVACGKTVGQFVADFYQWGLVRQATPAELLQWTDALAQAQQQGPTQTLAVAQNLGSTIFQSQEYANRARADRDFVFDLFKAWLQRDPDPGGWDFWTSIVPSAGRAAVVGAFAGSGEFQSLVGGLCTMAFDADGDGLPDAFESQVADAFTPHYHVSVGEPDQFATFNDSPISPESIKQLFGPVPVSHFRVHKEGFSTNASGAPVSVLRIDYLTLWNQDDGLVGGAACAWSELGLDNVVSALFGHYLDHEHSAMLVAAPVSGGDYNLDPGSYSIYNIYTSGHEFTIADTSMYASFFSAPVPAGNHIELALSRSKHSTYTFNPDYLPLTPWYIIDGTYAGHDAAYFDGSMPLWLYLALQAIADDVFFACIVERFTDQGGRYADLRINVGEPGMPINGSSFIAVPDINKQFTTPYFH